MKTIDVMQAIENHISNQTRKERLESYKDIIEPETNEDPSDEEIMKFIRTHNEECSFENLADNYTILLNPEQRLEASDIQDSDS